MQDDYFHSPAMLRRLAKRRAGERRFRYYGLCAVVLGFVFLATLFVSIASRGYTAWWQTAMQVSVDLNPEAMGLAPDWAAQDLARVNYQGLIKRGLRADFPQVKTRRERRALTALVSPGAG